MNYPFVALKNLLSGKELVTGDAPEPLIPVFPAYVHDHLVFRLALVVAALVLARQPDVRVQVRHAVNLPLTFGIKHPIAVGARERRGVPLLAMRHEKRPVRKLLVAARALLRASLAVLCRLVVQQFFEILEAGAALEALLRVVPRVRVGVDSQLSLFRELLFTFRTVVGLGIDMGLLVVLLHIREALVDADTIRMGAFDELLVAFLNLMARLVVSLEVRTARIGLLAVGHLALVGFLEETEREREPVREKMSLQFRCVETRVCRRSPSS